MIVGVGDFWVPKTQPHQKAEQSRTKSFKTRVVGATVLSFALDLNTSINSTDINDFFFFKHFITHVLDYVFKCLS